jgi:hypothetical protein
VEGSLDSVSATESSVSVGLHVCVLKVESGLPSVAALHEKLPGPALRFLSLRKEIRPLSQLFTSKLG